MISQEMKDRIIVDISESMDEEGHKEVKIEDPVVLLDASGDPWVIDVRVVELFYVDEYEEWEPIGAKTDEQEKIYADCVTVVFGVGEVEEPFMIKREDDPEFIEKCAMAFKMRNL